MTRLTQSRIVAALLVPLLACGGGAGGGGGGTPAAGQDLTPFQQTNGIGPITRPVELGAVDPAMAEAGAKVFEVKCSACHKMREKYVGPALGDVTTRRTPAYIMNMILNPQEMVERHPVAKQLLAEYLSFMANQGVSEQEARRVVEYLRTQAEEPGR